MTKQQKQEYWESVDWSLPSDELVAVTKASYPSIAKWAKILGKTIVRKKRVDSINPRGATLKITDEEFASSTNTELSKVHGVCRERIRQIRNKRGLAKFKCKPKWEGIDLSQKSSVIMAQYGMTRREIYYARKKLGIAEYEYSTPATRGVDIKQIKNWNVPIDEIAKQLGVSKVSAYRFRKKHVMTTLHEV